MAKQEFKPVFINNVVTPGGRLSFPHLAKPDSVGKYPDGKFKGTFLFPMKDGQFPGLKKADMSRLKKAVLDCISESWPGQQLGINDLAHNPFRKGDDKPELVGYEGTILITAKTKNRPQCVYRDKATIDVEDVSSELYGGVNCRAVLTVMSYEMSNKPGITFLLETVQKLSDSERFGASGNGAAALDALDDDDEDLLGGGDDEDLLGGGDEDGMGGLLD